MKRAGTNGRRRGSVMVEFTLSLLVLIPLALGGWSFGTAFFRYAELGSAVRAGARYASTLNYDSATSTPSASFLSAVQKMTVYGDPNANAATATPLVPGLSTANVNLTVGFANSAPSTMTVSITGFQVPTYIGTATLSGKPYVWFPYVGYWAPP